MLVRVGINVLTRNNVTASGRADGQAVADAVVAAALAFQRGPARDDIAVVVVKVPFPGLA
jgi:hypothetical protein